MLLKILFYWFMNNTFSSRKIANKLKSDIWFMFLAWNNQPDFRTINNFRKNKWELLEKVFVQIIMLAKKMWLIKFGTFSIDWTKIYANASKQKNIDLIKKYLGLVAFGTSKLAARLYKKNLSKFYSKKQKINLIRWKLYIEY